MFKKKRRDDTKAPSRPHKETRFHGQILLVRKYISLRKRNGAVRGGEEVEKSEKEIKRGPAASLRCGGFARFRFRFGQN